MDERAWLTCTNPDRMLAYLLAHRVSRRKLRLLACALVRRWWSSLGEDTACRSAVIASEQYANRRIDRGALLAAVEAAQMAVDDAPQFEMSAYQAALACAEENPRAAVQTVLRQGQQMARWQAAYECIPSMNETVLVTEAQADEQAGQCAVFRELIGNPFRFVPIEPDWLSWNDGCIRRMARQIDDEQNWCALPILADAVSDAGCTDSDMINHLRSGAQHSPGCWALDCLLGQH